MIVFWIDENGEFQQSEPIPGYRASRLMNDLRCRGFDPVYRVAHTGKRKGGR